MCVVSMVGDHFNDKWKKDYPGVDWNDILNPKTTPGLPKFELPITRAEFNELKKEVELVKELLKKSLKYDEENNQPHCEIEEKIALIRKISELVGVDMSEVFPKE